MRIVGEYLLRVTKVVFSRAFILLDLIALVLVFTSIQLQNVPYWVGIVGFVLLAFIATFKVWEEEKKSRLKSEQKLSAHLDKIPAYQIEAKVIQRFSIQEIVDKSEQELKDLERKINQEKLAMQKASSIGASNFWEKATQQLNAVTRILDNTVTAEESYQDLLEYVSELKKYEARLKRTYKIKLFVTASKTDEGLVIKASPKSNDVELVLEDNFVEDHMPERKHSGIHLYMKPSLAMPTYTLDRHSDVEDNILETEIGHINGDQEVTFPNAELFIVVDKEVDSVIMEFELYSANLPKRIQLSIPINLG